MPRNYQPKNILNTDWTNLEKAFNHRVATQCSLKEACTMFGVKSSTLGDAFNRAKKYNDGTTFVPKQQNVKKVFTEAQEYHIEQHAIKIARMFYGLSTRAFRTMVLKYAEAVNSPAIPEAWKKEGMATREWYYGFMNRHPTLALKAPEGMSLARAMAFNRVNVDVFFNAYIEAVESHHFTPDRIFNLDESGLSTVMKPSKVVCERGRPVASQVARERGSHMTFVGIVNAAGHGFPPVFIAARKKMNPAFKRGTTAGTTVLLQTNGWMDHELFVETLQHLQKVSYASKDNKILLIMDNAESHMSIRAVEYAIDHGIVIVTLPPHTTAKLQPLDVSVFGPFKTVLRSIQDSFKLSNPHVPITEHMLPQMACEAWAKVCSVSNITNGFRATGIFPIDRNIFPDDVFAGSEVTEQAPPNDDDDDEAPPTSASTTPVRPMTPASSTTSMTTPTSSTLQTPLQTELTPEAIQPYPKAPRRLPSAGRGRKKIRACILTEDEEALSQLREKEEKKAAREEKKRQLEEKRLEKKQQQQAAKRRRMDDATTSEDEDADNPALVFQDSSEYSEEFGKELELDIDDEYPFVKKETQVDDYVLVCFAYEKQKELVHYVGEVKQILEDGQSFHINFLRMKANCKDSFGYPDIPDEMDVESSKVLGVLPATKGGSTTRQAHIIKVKPPLTFFNMR